MTTILVIEDEPAIIELIRVALSTEGFHVLAVESAEEAAGVLRETPPDLILMDWMLPGKSGLQLTREFKQSKLTRDIPVIMLTALDEEQNKIRGFEVGTDDYVTKPFSPRELVARIRAVLRRTAPHKSIEILQHGLISLDPASHAVTVGGRPVALRPTEFRLLQFLMAHPERVYSRSQLLDLVWGSDAYVDERTVDTSVKRLRDALEPAGCDACIQTVRGIGYKLSEKG